jgi:hypothetical protein
MNQYAPRPAPVSAAGTPARPPSRQATLTSWHGWYGSNGSCRSPEHRISRHRLSPGAHSESACGAPEAAGTTDEGGRQNVRPAPMARDHTEAGAAARCLGVDVIVAGCMETSFPAVSRIRSSLVCDSTVLTLRC